MILANHYYFRIKPIGYYLMEDPIEKYFLENQQCFDRFTFDKIFRFLLTNEFTQEEAKDTIICNCSLSALVFQERIYNDFYLTIKMNEKISEDLLKLKNEVFNS